MCHVSSTKHEEHAHPLATLTSTGGLQPWPTRLPQATIGVRLLWRKLARNHHWPLGQLWASLLHGGGVLIGVHMLSRVPLSGSSGANRRNAHQRVQGPSWLRSLLPHRADISCEQLQFPGAPYGTCQYPESHIQGSPKLWLPARYLDSFTTLLHQKQFNNWVTFTISNIAW